MGYENQDVKAMVQKAKEARTAKFDYMKKEVTQVSKEAANYLAAKAKGRKYFY